MKAMNKKVKDKLKFKMTKLTENKMKKSKLKKKILFKKKSLRNYLFKKMKVKVFWKCMKMNKTNFL
jgi:hypothetical protein